jgi:hypothetical protein
MNHEEVEGEREAQGKGRAAREGREVRQVNEGKFERAKRKWMADESIMN